MRYLFSLIVLGCGVASAKALGAAPPSSTQKAVRSPVARVEANAKRGDNAGCGCPSKSSLLLAKQRKAVLAYCDKLNNPALTRWDEIQQAQRTLCYPYTFVNISGQPELDVCASLGFVVAKEHLVPRDVRACASKCNYLQRGVCPQRSQKPGEKYYDDHVILDSDESDRNEEYDDQDDNEEYEDYDEYSESSAAVNDDARWTRNKKAVVLCKQVKCQNCQSPALLTFDDGEVKGCDLFVSEGEGNKFVYRGFQIKNAGIYDPWAHRCDTASICCFQSDIDAIISKPHVLINSNPLLATSIARVKPFGLVSMFMTYSTKSYEKPASMVIKAFVGRKLVCQETVLLKTGCPVCFKPENTKAFSSINKLEFTFDLIPSRLKDAYIDIDNILVCM